MNPIPPFSLPPLPGWPLLQNVLASVQPPDWVVDEVQNRMVLLLNHILMQEPAAQERLRRQQGKAGRLIWGRFQMTLIATPAGLLERPSGGLSMSETLTPDLVVRLTQTAWPEVVAVLSQGEKPAVTIEGDVLLAAEVAWLVDHVRWDMEEDLARVLGDVPAHALLHVLSTAAQGVKAFVARIKPSRGSSDPASPLS